MSALTSLDSSAPVATSHGGSTELVPVRDSPATGSATAAADDRDTATSEEQLEQRRTAPPHHGSMTFIVDVGGGVGGRDGTGGSIKDLATPLSDCLPAWLRRKSVQYRTEREDRDEDHETEVM